MFDDPIVIYAIVFLSISLIMVAICVLGMRAEQRELLEAEARRRASGDGDARLVIRVGEGPRASKSRHGASQEVNRARSAAGPRDG